MLSSLIVPFRWLFEAILSCYVVEWLTLDSCVAGCMFISPKFVTKLVGQTP